MALSQKLRSAIEGQLIVSCQAADGDPFRDTPTMVRFALAAVNAGAAGIRANGIEDIAAIRQAVGVPIIGIEKQMQDDGRILITPSFEGARALMGAGADIIALDCTRRGRGYGALARLAHIKRELDVAVVADIATLDEAVQAVAGGADAVLTTMRGYTDETAGVETLDLAFLEELLRTVHVPVIAEGRIATPEQAAAAMGAGALAVIVGSAITRPRDIAERFVAAVRQRRRAGGEFAIGIDLGGTNTKFAVVRRDGRLFLEESWPTPALDGRDVLLAHLKSVVTHLLRLSAGPSLPVSSVGIATAGWVDPVAGRVVYATGNLPGWTGTGIREELESSVRLPVAVENDANALAVAESHFGVARGHDNFVCITLGTGVGGGCYVGGRLNRGANCLGNGLGHIALVEDGLACTCGQRGCLETYANAAALVRYGGGRFESAEALVKAARGGDVEARSALSAYAHHLAGGCAMMVHLLDPDLVVLSGGIAKDNEMLRAELQQALAARLNGGSQRRLQVVISPLGNYGGVLGAAAAAFDRTA